MENILSFRNKASKVYKKEVTEEELIKMSIKGNNQENQKNLNEDGSKMLQLHYGCLLGTEGVVQLSWSQPLFTEAITNENKDVPGMFYIGISKEIGDKKGEEYEIVVEDNTRGGQVCIKEYENLEHHENSIYPRIIKFDTKISNK